MANLSEDIQCAGFDTRPPMLDRTDFASWKQRIQLYCRGKENGVNILKSINEGPFQMGTFRETLADGNEGALHLGLFPTDNLIENLTNTLALLSQSYKTYLPQTNNQLRTSSNTRNQAIVQDGRVVVQNVQGQQNKGQGNIARGTGAAGNEGVQNRVRNENRVVLDEEQLLFIAGGQDNDVDEDVDELPVQDLALNVDNVFQADEHDAFDSNVDEAPTAQTMFMANLSSTDPVYDKANLSYDSNILYEVHDHDNYQDAVCEHHQVYEMHNDVQPNCLVDSDAEYMGDTNMIMYDQYLKDNAEPVVQNNVSFIPNDAYMIIIRLNSCTEASGSKPRSNTKKNRISPAKSVNKKKVEEHPRTNKSSWKKSYHVDSSISSKRAVVQIILWYLDSGCSKHMMRNHSRLRNFMKKFIETVKFENDHFGAIMGYRYYVIGDSVISRVYYMKGLGHNLFSVGQVGIFHQKSILRTPQQNGVVERRNRTLVEATRTIEDLGKLQPTADIGIFIGYAPNGTPSSTTIDQDVPSLSYSSSSLEIQPRISHQGFAAGSIIIKDNPFATADNDPFVNMFVLEPSSEASSSKDISSVESIHVTQPHHHLKKWSKNYLLDNVI
nr:integrase, catalytic region, zinc finger, CCHC-type, peptidase aspartic, catalytic [Tanacetum cinerariifolium]